MDGPSGLGAVLLSPPVLVTFIVCLALGGAVIWLLNTLQHGHRNRALAQQRQNQEATIERVLDSVAKDKEQLVAEYESRLRERDDRIAALEREANRLKDRQSSGILGVFGGKQREIISALLLENEQLHELLSEKQTQLRDMFSDMTSKMLDQLDLQTQESARAIRYKQALLSAFLQQEEARRLLDRMMAEGRVTPTPSTSELPEE